MNKKLDFPPKYEQQWVLFYSTHVQLHGMDFRTMLNTVLSGILTLATGLEQDNYKSYRDTNNLPETIQADDPALDKYMAFMTNVHDTIYDMLNTAFSELLARWSPDAQNVPASDSPIHNPDITVEAIIAMENLLIAERVNELPEAERKDRVAALVEDITRRTEHMREESKMGELYREEMTKRQERFIEATTEEEE